jgi:hypothetical protein
MESLVEKLKKQFFRATVDSVLLYGSTTWTLTKQQQSSLDGTYTRMLRADINVSWKRHPTNKRLYGNTPELLILYESADCDWQDTYGGTKLKRLVTFCSGTLATEIDTLVDPTEHLFDQLSDEIRLHASLLPTAMSDRRDMITSIRN